MNELKMCLCEGRHSIPDAVDGSIFGNIVDPLDFAAMQEVISKKISDELEHLNLYVTGLTVALVEVIKYCQEHEINLTLWHYDRNSNSYYSQPVIKFYGCPFCGGALPEGAHYCPKCGAT